MLKKIKQLAIEFWNDERGDIGSVLGIGGSILGGIMGNSAADAQVSAANAATQLQKQQYAQTRSDQMPWLQAGGGAINQLSYLMGLTPYQPQTLPAFSMDPNAGNNNAQRDYQREFDRITRENDQRTRHGLQPLPLPQAPAAQTPQTSSPGAVTPNYPGGGFGSLAKPFSMADYQADPGYAFRLAEGQKALERSQAAKGGLLSGAAAKAMDSYSQGLASQEYQNAYDRYNTNQANLYNRLAGIAGTGQTAAGNISNAGQNYANQAGNNMTSAGAARSAGITNMGNMFQTGLGYLGNALGGTQSSYYPNSGITVNWD